MIWVLGFRVKAQELANDPKLLDPKLVIEAEDVVHGQEDTPLHPEP